jgi:hypothetical protein
MPRSARDAEKLVLRNPENIAAAIIYASLLAFAGKHLVSWMRARDASDVMPVILFWGIAALLMLACLVRAVAGGMVARKSDGQVTISLSLGPIALWRIRSVVLDDLASIAVCEHVRRFRGNKIRRYTIVYQYAGAQMELLGGLSRQSASLLVEFLDSKHSGGTRAATWL